MSRLRLWFRRIVRSLLLFVAVVLVAALAWIYWQRDVGYRDMQAIVAELDASAPDWRLPAIEAKRRVVPDDKNGALVANAAFRLFAKDWKTDLDDEMEKTPPNVRFDKEAMDLFRGLVQANQAAIGEARKLVDYPTGRFRIAYVDDFLSTKLEDQENARTVAEALEMDACVAAEEKKPERAVPAIRALVHLGNYHADEPMFLSQLTRNLAHTRAFWALERTLAQGQLADADLATLQKDMSEQANVDRFFVGLHGERAGMHDFLTRAESDSDQIRLAMTKANGMKESPPSALDRLFDIPWRVVVYQSHARILRHETKMLAAEKLTGHERYDALEKLEMESKLLTDYRLLLARSYFSGVNAIWKSEERLNTWLSCAAAGCAAERFRLKEGRWPADLDELVRAKLLPAAPIDLYTGDPLQFRRAADGIVIHSAGFFKQKYTGDYLDPQSQDKERYPYRLEFRLWDVPERGKAPPVEERIEPKELDDRREPD
jgi:hypothetical protein